MRTLLAAGGGMAASICKRHDALPRQVYSDHLIELKELMLKGVGKLPVPQPPAPPAAPKWMKAAGENLARSAKVKVSGDHKAAQYPASNINDGRVSYSDNNLRWVSDEKTPAVVELAWDKPQKSARPVSSAGERRWTARGRRLWFVSVSRRPAFREIPGDQDGGEPVRRLVNASAVTNDRVPGHHRTPGDHRIWEFEVTGRSAVEVTNVLGPLTWTSPPCP